MRWPWRPFAGGPDLRVVFLEDAMKMDLVMLCLAGLCGMVACLTPGAAHADPPPPTSKPPPPIQRLRPRPLRPPRHQRRQPLLLTLLHPHRPRDDLRRRRAQTEKQMAQVLHFSLPPDQLHPALAALANDLNAPPPAAPSGQRTPHRQRPLGPERFRHRSRNSSNSSRPITAPHSARSISPPPPKPPAPTSTPGSKNKPTTKSKTSSPAARSTKTLASSSSTPST